MAELEATVVAAGFTGFAITGKADVFAGAPQASSAAAFGTVGTVGITFQARKATAETKRNAGPAASDRADPLPGSDLEQGGLS